MKIKMKMKVKIKISPTRAFVPLWGREKEERKE